MTTMGLAGIPLPTNWKIIPAGYLFQREKRTGYQGEQLLSVYRDYGVVIKSSRDDNFNKTSEDLSTYQLVEPNDLVINKMKAWQGSVGISEYKGIVSPAYFVARPLREFSRRYVHYLLRCSDYLIEYQTRSAGIRVNQWDLDWDDFRRIPITLPPLSDQERIATFLDDKTARIDALIAEKERLIELVQELRQSTISSEVTIGPNEPGWRQTRLKFLVEEIIDTEHKTVPFYEDGEYLVARTSNIKNGRLTLDDAKYTNEAGFEEWTRRGIPVPGNILFTREAPAGEACLVPEGIPLCLGQRTVLIRLRRDLAYPMFILWSIYGGLASKFISDLSQGSTVAHFNMPDIGNIPLFIGPIKEQQLRAEALLAKLTHLDEMIDHVSKHIYRLREYRSSLISATVTGQNDLCLQGR